MEQISESTVFSSIPTPKTTRANDVSPQSSLQRLKNKTARDVF